MKIILRILKPKGYNTPQNFRVLYNQWLHQGYVWKLWSYDFYNSHQKETIS